jgi:EAL domain-containing protein (putative c-di-GMP-specific phosphodiesterase class I)
MADFLQVADQRERITDWLRSLLHSLCGLNHKMLVEEDSEDEEEAAPDARELVQMLHDTQVRFSSDQLHARYR